MDEQLLKEISATLTELLKWSRFAGVQQLRGILIQSLRTDSEMLVYDLSDGTRGTREIAKMAKIGSNATVAMYWKKWSKIGIVEPSKSFQGRYKHICSMEEAGLKVPEKPKADESSKDDTEVSVVG